MKRVITYGTFDLLHYGHINLLRRAKEQRKMLLEAIRYVDLVIPEENWEQKKTDCKLYHVDTFVMGDDWAGKFDFLKDQGVEVVYLPRTPEVSTTQIKQDLNQK